MHNRTFNNDVADRLHSVESAMRAQGRGHKAIRSAIRNELRAIGIDVLEGVYG